jgi:isoleucyl-tRNA synthetase
VTDNRICVGSREELQHLTGVMLDDLHRENVDDLTFSIDGEAGTYRRIEEVLDCWFESGSMPYAQLHYPFENDHLFQQGFPAEFIAEGLDQTRGWFYTLIVLGACLFDKPAFKNVVVNGIVMAGDGKKMSKRLKNYTAPDELMEEYGADALRLYLINSGLVKAEEQRFTDSGVKDMVRRALLPWLNSFKFFKTYAEIDAWGPSLDAENVTSDNIVDRWILSRLQTLKVNVAEEMEQYRLYNVVPALFKFIEDLTNWYIRLNRARFWADEMTDDKQAAYGTLYTAIYELSLSMAPFAPFLSEYIYLELKSLDQRDLPDSVHLCSYPEAHTERVDPLLEQAVERMQNIILLGRQKRNQEKIRTKVPLPRLTIIHEDQALLDEIALLEDYVKAELNVKHVAYSTAEDDYINFYARPNSPVLGKRLGKEFRKFKGLIENLEHSQLNQLAVTGSIELEGEAFSSDDILVFREAKEGTRTLSNRFISIDLECELNQELIDEGLAREVVNRVQKTRKELNFNVTDRIKVVYSGSDDLCSAIETHLSYISHETLANDFSRGEVHKDAFDFNIDDFDLRLDIKRVS